MKKVLCPGEALIDFVSMNAGKSLKATNGFIKKAIRRGYYNGVDGILYERKYSEDSSN